MTATLTIRRATPADVTGLTALARRTFFDTFAADNDPADMQAYLDRALAPAAVGAELADARSVFLLADRGDGEAACGYAKAVFPSPRPGATDPQPALELSRLYVDRDALGQGVGAALMRAIFELASRRGAAAIWLGVWEHNHRALAFYRRFGFEVVGEQPFLLGTDLQTDLVMTRLLATA